jgi:hypothetical protein
MRVRAPKGFLKQFTLFMSSHLLSLLVSKLNTPFNKKLFFFKVNLNIKSYYVLIMGIGLILNGHQVGNILWPAKLNEILEFKLVYCN